jgi:hypothetical protein
LPIFNELYFNLYTIVSIYVIFWLFFVFWYFILNFNNLINVYCAFVHDKSFVHDKYIMLIKLKILSSYWHITPLKLTIFWTAENYTERKVYNNGNAQGTCIGGVVNTQSSPYCISFAILTQHAYTKSNLVYFPLCIISRQL